MGNLTKNQVMLIRSLYTRHGRKKHNYCICEGGRCCRELVRLRPDLIENAICTDEFDTTGFSVDFIRIHEKEMQQFTGTVTSQGVLFVVRKPNESSLPDSPPADPFITVLDGVSDPGNFGTILRTVMAVGLNELWYTKGSVDPFSDKVIRSAIAAQFGLRIIEFDDLAVLIDNLEMYGYKTIYRTDPHDGRSCFSVKNLFHQSAIILGNEASGIHPLKNAESVTLPMPGKSESINVAQAATVILFEYVRRFNFVP